MKMAWGVKRQLIIFLVCFALFAVFAGRDPAFLKTLAIAVLAAVTADALIGLLKGSAFVITESSIISGLIIGLVLYDKQPWWQFIVAAALAVLSKHAIRFRNKHIFNPAAFGILFAMLLFGASTGWKGTYLWYILVPFGIYFSYKVRKLELLAGYFVVALVLFGVQALAQKVALGAVFGYLSYFYIFVMIIEPKTTPLTPLGKYLFGTGVAAVIFVLTNIGVGFDAELAGLLMMNAAVPLLNKLK